MSLKKCFNCCSKQSEYNDEREWFENAPKVVAFQPLVENEIEMQTLEHLYNDRKSEIRQIYQSVDDRISDYRQQCMDRLNYREILMNTPILKNLPNDSIAELSTAMEEKYYCHGEYIIHQGTRGEHFYIISSGKVRVTIDYPNSGQERFIRRLGKGDFFGEKALLNSDGMRTANVIVHSPSGATCLVIDKSSFEQLIAPLDGVSSRYDDDDPNNDCSGH